MPKRIRVFFINCPTLATDAAAFLILAQNKAQNAIQFEIHHFWLTDKSPSVARLDKILEKAEDRYPRFKWLAQRNRTLRDLRAAPSFQETFQHKTWYDHAKKAIDDYDRWFNSTGYNKYDYEPAPAIVVTETALAGNYISSCRERVAIVSLTDWKAFFKPGSALEYILTNVQRLSLRLSYGPVIGSHFPTRGCIWDFDVHQPDIRISAFLGLLCSTCRQSLKAVIGDAEFKEIETLVANEWIGKRDDPFSVVSALAKNYRYDIRRATGLSPGLASSISQGMKTEIGKFFLEILKWVLILLTTIALATYFPTVYKILQK